MAELGGHQLDAAGIFIHAMHKAVDPKAEMPRPLSVAAAGGRPLFPARPRRAKITSTASLEFPSPGYKCRRSESAAPKKIGVQYASINGDGFGGYGETVFGTEGTLVLEGEKDAMLYQNARDHQQRREVVPAKTRKDKKKHSPALKVDDKGDPESAAIGTLGTLPADPGYTEELEHWAWCIRHRAPENLPALPSKGRAGRRRDRAGRPDMAARQGARRIDFKKEWFDIDDDATPEDVKPDVKRYT